MSVIEHLNPFHHQSGFATTNSMVGITEDGKKALDRGMITGREYPVMTALDGSTMSISNLSREAGMSPQEVERQVKGLRRQGYVAVREFNENKG